MLRRALLVFYPFLLIGCAYELGYQARRLPGGYRTVSIPVFANVTQEVGMEGFFTNALIREFERSRVASIADKSYSPVFIEGKINSVVLSQNGQTAANSRSAELRFLPKNTVLNTGYRVVVEIHIKLIRNSDKTVIWQQNFVNERVFSAPQISVPGINSVNPLYNQSAKIQNVEVLAQEMMREAHDRLTERF